MNSPKIIIFSILVGLAALYSSGEAQPILIPSAEKFVHDFFKYYDKKNVAKMEGLLSKTKRGTVAWELDKL